MVSVSVACRPINDRVAYAVERSRDVGVLLLLDIAQERIGHRRRPLNKTCMPPQLVRKQLQEDSLNLPNESKTMEVDGKVDTANHTQMHMYTTHGMGTRKQTDVRTMKRIMIGQSPKPPLATISFSERTGLNNYVTEKGVSIHTQARS